MTQYAFRSKVFIVLALCLLLFPAGYAQNGSHTKKELESKKKRINEEIRQISNQLNATKASKKNSIGTLLSINVKLKKRQELIRMINLEMALLDKDISRSQEQADKLNSSLAKLKEDYANMIRFSQRNQDSYTVLMFIFAADNFNQALARLRYIRQYAEFRRRQAAEISQTRAELDKKLQELKEQQTEKQSLLGTEQIQQQALSSEKSQHEKVLTDLQKKEHDLKKQLEKKKEDAVKLQLAIKRLIDEEIKRKAEEARKREEAKRLALEKARREDAAKKNKNVKTAPAPASGESKTKKEALVPELSEEAMALSADFSNNRGRLPWPVAKGVICEQYGQHEHPAIKGFMMFNNGIEICCGQGTQARAVFEGEVTGIALSPAGGKLVIIRHGEYLSVYSNLDDVMVKTGQKVSVRQPIGTVLYDAEEGKGTMGFQIWKEQKTMDPAGWLVNGR